MRGSCRLGRVMYVTHANRPMAIVRMHTITMHVQRQLLGYFCMHAVSHTAAAGAVPVVEHACLWRNDDSAAQTSSASLGAHRIISLEHVVVEPAGEGWRGNVAEDMDHDRLDAEGERLQVHWS